MFPDKKYKYTQNWFLKSEIKKNFDKFFNKKNRYNILEIGSYEGLSSVYFADNLLNNDNATLTCVDPFLSIDDNDHVERLDLVTEKIFLHNISKSKNKEKITFHRCKSADFFKKNTQTYNFIYIDGSHIPEIMIHDIDNAYKILENNGIIWIDDYGAGEIRYKPIDKQLQKYDKNIEIIHKGYQIAFTKMAS